MPSIFRAVVFIARASQQVLPMLSTALHRFVYSVSSLSHLPDGSWSPRAHRILSPSLTKVSSKEAELMQSAAVTEVYMGLAFVLQLFLGYAPNWDCVSMFSKHTQ